LVDGWAGGWMDGLVGGWMGWWVDGCAVGATWPRASRRAGNGRRAVSLLEKAPHASVCAFGEGGEGPPAASRLCVKWRPRRSGQCASMGHRWAWNRSVGRLVERRGEGGHWLGGGASEKPRGRRAPTALFPRGHTTPAVPSPQAHLTIFLRQFTV
jgi:hypothetical protein